MFIKQKIFDKIINKTYKGVGFTIAMLDMINENGEVREKYIIQSAIGTWRIITDCKYFPKEAKATIIKLIGEMPKKGECWTATEDSVQVEMIEMVMHPIKTKKNILTKTDIYIQDNRVYQDLSNRVIYLMSNIFDLSVSNDAIDDKYESYPAGPYIDKSDEFILFENETTRFEIGKRFIEPDSEMESVIQKMEEVLFI